MRWIICFLFLFVLLGCKKGARQVILLRNLSSEDIYYLVSKDKLVTNPDDIASIRPVVPWELDQINVEGNDSQEAKNSKQTLYQHLIQKDSLEVILTSESVGIFIDAVTIRSIIRDRFNEQLNIFIITKKDLDKYSDQEILDKRLSQLFKALTATDIDSDALILEYQ